MRRNDGQSRRLPGGGFVDERQDQRGQRVQPRLHRRQPEAERNGQVAQRDGQSVAQSLAEGICLQNSFFDHKNPEQENAVPSCAPGKSAGQPGGIAERRPPHTAYRDAAAHDAIHLLLYIFFRFFAIRYIHNFSEFSAETLYKTVKIGYNKEETHEKAHEAP